MKVIWKYILRPFSPFSTFSMPRGAKILSVQVQKDLPCMWIMLDPTAPKVKRYFTALPTGHKFDESKVSDFIGTVQFDDLVFHIFEVPAEATEQEPERWDGQE